MCQPGSRGLSARSERSVPVREIYGDRDRLGGVGGRPSLRPTPAAAPRIDETKAVAAISGPTASNVTRALTGAPAPMAPAAPQALPSDSVPAAPTMTRRIVSSIRRMVSGTSAMSPVAIAPRTPPADFEAAHRDDILGQLAEATASVQSQPSNAVMLPSGVEFRGNDVQKQLVREFLKIAKQVADLPTGVEHKDARKAARTSLCYQIQKLLGMRFVDADKRRFARTVSAELKSRLPADTDLSQILPVFIQEWAEGRNM